MASSFTLHAAPGTDVWRKPPHTDVYNVPRGPVTSKARALARFRSARVSFSFPWVEQYDQGGLLLSFRPAAAATAPPPRWIKTGVEFYNGRPMLGTVACDAWADWSLAPLVEGADADEGDGQWTTVSVEKGDEHGASLWVYQIMPDGTKAPLREICWVYGHGHGGGAAIETEEWELEVVAFAARPLTTTKEGLEVKFRGFEVQWEE